MIVFWRVQQIGAVKKRQYLQKMVFGKLDKMDFLGSSVVKESTCNAGDPGLIPGSGRSAGEGIGYPLQFSSAFLVAQTVGNLPVKWKTWI